MTRRTHDTDTDVAELLDQGLNQQQVADRLGMSPSGVSRARKRLGINPHTAPATIEDAWRAKTNPTDDGHLLWTGPRGAKGQLIVTHKGRQHSAQRVAFRIQHGRDPEGVVRITCDRDGCVHPEHTEDTATRQRNHLALRYIQGRTAMPEACPAGHDMAVHGHIDSGGDARCRACQAASRPGGSKKSPTYLLIEDAWAARTQATDDGHLLWTGPLRNGRTPLLLHKSCDYSAWRISWIIARGDEPEGPIQVTCGQPLCVLPAHLEDGAARDRQRALLRYISGTADAPRVCAHGHDRAEHGRLSPDGDAYCAECKRLAKRHSRAVQRAIADLVA